LTCTSRAVTRPWAIAAAALLWLVLSGCASLLAPAASEEEQRALAAAIAQMKSDPATARADLEQLIETWPRSPLLDQAEYALGQIALGEGDTPTALRHFRHVVEAYPSSGRADAARVRIAQIERAEGNDAEARTIMGRARLSRLEGEELRDAYRVLANVAPDPVARLRWLARLRAETSDQSALEAIDVEIDAIVTSLDAEGLARAERQLGDRVPAARVQLARAELALAAGDFETARAALKRADSLALSVRYAPRFADVAERVRLREQGITPTAQLPSFAEAMRNGLPDTNAASGSIGVVLPLTGAFARFGEESLQGILLATHSFERVADGGGNVRVVVRDSAGDAKQAAAAVRDLAQDGQISAIVGPLLSTECEAAAQVAERAEVPLLTLSARESIASDRPYVFRLRTRPIEDVQLLVARARAQGAQRFGVLYRNDAYGRGLRSLFWDAVEERGGEMVAAASYDPQATDFAEPIRRLVGYTLLSDEERKLLGKREDLLRRARRASAEEGLELRQRAAELTTASGEPLPPIVDFDALFIPDGYEKIVLIAPQLAFNEVVDTRLLGPDGWYDEDLVRLGRDNLKGALFTAHFYPDSPVPYVHDFGAHFADTFERAPGVFAAQAYDAANLVLTQLAHGRQRRESVRRGVLATQGYPGVSGVINMGADGNAHKRPYLLGVERGHIVQYDD
jgi:ABC-type branched-subunit amino acid transport system substrate-binding protein